MALLNCKECGRSVSTEAAACPQCGAPPPRASDVVSPIPLAVPAASVAAAVPPRKKSGAGVLLGVIGCVACVGIGVVVLAAGGGAVFFMGARQPTTLSGPVGIVETRESFSAPARVIERDDDAVPAPTSYTVKAPAATATATPTATPTVTPTATPTATATATATPPPAMRSAPPAPAPVRTAIAYVAPKVTYTAPKAPQVIARPITSSELTALSRPATPPASAFSLPACSAPAPAPAVVAAAPAAPTDPTLRILRTQSGERRVHVGKKLAIEGTDGVGRLGVLVNVQGGFVDVQFDDKVRRIAEADVRDASEL